jgi:hypothetical protein
MNKTILAGLALEDSSTLVSWGLDISVVPEPTTRALIVIAIPAGGVMLVRAGRRFSRRIVV